MTAWDPARLGALDRSERPARPRVAHQRSSRPATPPGRTPVDSSSPAQETTMAGCEPAVREAGTPAACPRGPLSRQHRRPCSNHRREEQLSGTQDWPEAGPFTAPGRPRPLRCACAQPHRGPGAQRRAGIPAPGAPAYVPRGPLASSQREAPEALGGAARRVMADPEASVVPDRVVA